jgi:lysophospholipase L1-like esterase
MIPGWRDDHRHESAIRPMVVERELLWADLEQAISTGGRRDEMILSDGVHMTEEAHERVATALLPYFEAFARRP